MNKNIVGIGVNDDYVSDIAKEFLSHLKTKGYNAILDSNDQFISGYSAKKPIILFNAASSVVKKGETIVAKEVSDRLNKTQMAVVYTRALAPTVGLGAAYIGGTVAMDTQTKYGAVNKYMKANPDTKKSYGEIYNALKPDINGNYHVNNAKL